MALGTVVGSLADKQSLLNTAPGSVPGWVLMHSSPPPLGTGRSCLRGGWAGINTGPSCLHLSLQDEEGSTSQAPEGCICPPATPRPRENDTVTSFHLLFSPTEPLGAEASADNSDNLILNKTFQAGN